MRSVVLDTETTGMPVIEGHRIIEIGCVEIVNRKLTNRHFHVYLQPDREIDEEAIKVHGITNEFLVDKPRFKDIANDFYEFIKGAQLIIHNAAFDIGFITNEFKLLDQADRANIESYCSVLDSLQLAREKHPGQRNSLDALCKRYHIDNSGRELHGALLDAELLADVYLNMTGGQTVLGLDAASSLTHSLGTGQVISINRLPADRPKTKVVKATTDELAEHELRLSSIEKAAGTLPLWKVLTDN